MMVAIVGFVAFLFGVLVGYAVTVARCRVALDQLTDHACAKIEQLGEAAKQGRIELADVRRSVEALRISTEAAESSK